MAVLYFKTKVCALMPLLLVSIRMEFQPVKYTFISGLKISLAKKIRFTSFQSKLFMKWIIIYKFKLNLKKLK